MTIPLVILRTWPYCKGICNCFGKTPSNSTMGFGVCAWPTLGILLGPEPFWVYCQVMLNACMICMSLRIYVLYMNTYNVYIYISSITYLYKCASEFYRSEAWRVTFICNIWNELRESKGTPMPLPPKKEDLIQGLLTTNASPWIPMQLVTHLDRLEIFWFASPEKGRSWRTSASARVQKSVLAGSLWWYCCGCAWLAWWTCCLSICQCILKSFLL